jgi:predicted GTPase
MRVDQMNNMQKPPVIIIVGTTGSGKSSFCNTLFSGYHVSNSYLPASLPFRMDSSHDKVCTLDIMKVKTESLFGNADLFGQCILLDTPGFSEKEDATRAVDFLNGIMAEKYITCFVVLTHAEGRFVNKQNLCILAMLKHIFGEPIFEKMIVVVNKWCLERNTERARKLQRTMKTDNPEVKMRAEINNVFAELNKKTTGQIIMFTNNFYEESERFYWEQFQCDLAMKVNTSVPIEITKRIIEHCKYYKDDPMKLFNYDKEYNHTPEGEMLAKSLANAEYKLQQLYTSWSGYVSVRLIFINESELDLSATSIETTEGYFETDATRTSSLLKIELEQLRLKPFSAVTIFHRKTWFGTYGARGKISYMLQTGETLGITWYVSYSNDAKNPQIYYEGTVLGKCEAIKKVAYEGTNTPYVRITLRIKGS